jgi:hypothetical protein
MKIKHLPAYLSLFFILFILSYAYYQFSPYRILIAIVIGLSYLCWGVLVHLKDKTLYWPVVLEYLGISLLAVITLIFISLRA